MPTVIEYAAGAEFSMHHTDTVDFDVALSGSVELILGDGAHPFAVGDAWCAGPAMAQLPGGGRTMVESGDAQSVDTLRCLISHASPSATKVSR